LVIPAAWASGDPAPTLEPLLEAVRRRLFCTSGFLSQVMLVKRLPNEDFDDGLPANVELVCRNVQFLKHVLCEVDVDSLYGRHHSTGVGKVPGNVLSTVGLFRNRFGGKRFLTMGSFLHKAFAPPWLPSTA
jgi:hypothetical protein